MEFQGIVKQVLPLESGVSKSGNQWSKASVIFDVTTNPQYPKLVKVSNMKKADVFAKLTPGTKVNLKVEIESREYNGRWYNEINAFKVEYPGVQQQAPQQQMPPQQMPQMQGGMPPQQMPPQAQGCQTYYQNGANQMPYNAPQTQMPPQMPPQQQMPQQQAPFPPQQ